MKEPWSNQAEELKRLQRCMNSLVRILALPAVRTVGEPLQILTNLLDALLDILDLEFTYAKLTLANPDGPIEVVKAAQPSDQALKLCDISGTLRRWFSDDPREWPHEVRTHFGDEEITVFPVQLDLHGGAGLIAAGSRRAGFPEEAERIVLSVAANQAVAGLQKAQLLTQQLQTASELDRKVAQRTEDLARANEQLRKEVADRKEVEERLRENETFLLDAQHLSHTGSWKHNFVSNTVSITPEIANLFAIEPHEDATTADFFFGRIHPDDRDVETKSYASALREKLSFESTYRIVLSDGSIRSIRNCGHPKLNDAGEVVEFLGTAFDVTEQVEARAALQHALDEITKSETRLRQVIDTIPTLSWCNLPDGPNEFLSKSWHEYTGLSPEEAHGWGWQVAFHPEDLPPLMEKWRELLISGQPGEIEARLRRNDGIYRWFLIRVEPLRDEAGKIHRWYGTSTDIEDRKRAEEALQATQRNLALIINSIPALAWSARPDGTAEFFNQGWLDYTGLTSKQAEDWGWKAAIHPDDLDRMVSYWQAVITTGEPVEIEGRLRRFDGAFRWFLFRAHAVRDESGAIVEWYGINTDIDDRKHAEEQVRRGEAFLVEGQRLSRTGTFSWRLETAEVRWSEELYRIFDFDSDLPVTLELIGSRVHPEDLPMMGEMIDRARRAEDQFEYQHRIVMPDGSIKYIHLIGHAVRHADGHLEYFGGAHDITQLRIAEQALEASERNLSTIINTIPALAWSAGPDGRIDFVNQRWLSYTGLSAEQSWGWGWMTAIHPQDTKAVTDYCQSSLTSGTPAEVEARICRFDGAYRWFLFRTDPLRDESGNVVKWCGTITDIDDHKRLEEALRANELSWRQIVDNIPGFVHTTSATGEVEFISRHTQEYFGKSSGELKDWSRLGIVHPDDLPRVIEAWRKSIETGEDYEVEQRNRRADGVYRWFQARGRAVRNEEGEITAWYWLNIDIDDRKKAEEALHANERNLGLIINTMPTLAWSARPDGSAEFFNQHYLDYVGLPLEKLQSWGWTVVVHPDDLNALSGVWQSVMAAGKPGEAEARLRRFDGEYRWFLFRVSPMRDDSGEIVKWYGTNTDIDDRERAEAELKESYLRLSEAQRLSKTGSFVTDLLADDHNWSEETLRIFGFDLSTKVTVQMIRDLVHPEDLPSFDSVITRGMTGKDVDFSFRILTNRGALKHIRGVARVIDQIAGRPLFIGALQDVTETKLAEEALSVARSELAHVARVTTLNTLTASIAHEINQPLSGIVVNASTCLLMLDSDPPNIDGARTTVRRAVRDANRASDVIKHLRALFKKKEVAADPVDLNDAAREVIALSLSELRRNRVILKDELADDLPRVTGDRIQLQQVILNLVRNASDAMNTVEDRPRQLLIRTEVEGRQVVRLTVQDTGVGFAPDAADKLFESFYTTKDDGMGIGLSVSRSIIEAHGGQLWAATNDGPGASFAFSVPCVTDPEPLLS